MAKTNQVEILKKTIKSLERETKVDPYKLERFRHQLQLALIKEEGR